MVGTIDDEMRVFDPKNGPPYSADFLRRYRAAQVPVALSTDDEGVSRIDLTHEYVRAALDYMMEVGRDRIRAHEESLRDYAHQRLGEMNSIRIIGNAPGKGAIVSFEMKGAHAHDVATVIDRQGVAVRAGTHCAMPLLKRFGTTSTCRASFGLYNTTAEIDALVSALTRAERMFA